MIVKRIDCSFSCDPLAYFLAMASRVFLILTPYGKHGRNTS